MGVISLKELLFEKSLINIYIYIYIHTYISINVNIYIYIGDGFSHDMNTHYKALIMGSVSCFNL